MVCDKVALVTGGQSASGPNHPMGRTGQAEDAAVLVAFLAADDSIFVTGQDYTVDGGRTAQLSLPG